MARAHSRLWPDVFARNSISVSADPQVNCNVTRFFALCFGGYTRTRARVSRTGMRFTPAPKSYQGRLKSRLLRFSRGSQATAAAAAMGGAQKSSGSSKNIAAAAHKSLTRKSHAEPTQHHDGKQAAQGKTAQADVAHKSIGHQQQSVKAAAPARPDTSASLFSMRSFNAETDLPFVYCSDYNMSMAGLELVHQFDTKKYSKLARALSEEFHDTPYARTRADHDELQDDETPVVENSIGTRKAAPRILKWLKPQRPCNTDEVALHHQTDYVSSIFEDKSLLARITEVWLLNLVPMTLIESRLLKPIMWQVAGTIFATHLAMQHGWAINLGGGFHQASSRNGDTFCIFSDIMIAIKYIWRKHPLQKFMIIDLDAHQAVGVERDIVDLPERRRKMVYMLDMYNGSIQPPDARADQGMDLRIELARFTSDETFLKRLAVGLDEAFKKFKPTIIIYVAGQDQLVTDQLGMMNLTDEALIKRDEMVFECAVNKHKCPIVMLLGGGFLSRGVKVQAMSIKNLYMSHLIWSGHRSGSRSLSRPRAKKPSTKTIDSDHNKKNSAQPHQNQQAPPPAAAQPQQPPPTPLNPLLQNPPTIHEQRFETIEAGAALRGNNGATSVQPGALKEKPVHAGGRTKVISLKVVKTHDADSPTSAKTTTNNEIDAAQARKNQTHKD